MKRIVLLIIMVLGTIGVAGATGFTVENTEAVPGETTTLGNLTAANSSGIVGVTNTSDFPLNWEYTDNGTHRTGPLTMTVPNDASPRPTGSFTVTTEWGNGTTTSSTVNYHVPAVSNVTINKENLSQDLSVGSDGLFGNLTLEQEGNSAESIGINTTGNLSQYIGVPSGVTMYRDRTYNLRVTYQVPRDTAFGHYTGSLLFVDSNDTVIHRVNLSSRFSDDISPSIEQVNLPETVMATTPLNVEATVTDNLNVSTVTATVVREVSVTNGNTTNLENQTLDTFQLGQQPQTDTWNVTVKDTDEIGTYYTRLTASDTSGNNDTVVERFSINGLNTTKILQNDIAFKGIRHQDTVTHRFLNQDIDKPFNITLEQFTYGGSTTVQPGIQTPSGQERYFDNDTKTLQFNDPGTYQLVVKSFDREGTPGSYDYTGEIKVSVPAQHYQLPDSGLVTFDGQINTEGRPEALCQTVGQLDMCIGYENTLDRFMNSYGVKDDEQDYAIRISRIPISQCMGSDSWDECTDSEMGVTRGLRDQIGGPFQFGSLTNLLTLSILANVLLMLIGGMIIRYGSENYSTVIKDTEKRV